MDQTQLELHLQHIQVLEGVASASGIVKFKDDFYVIGDDTSYLFHIDKNFDLISKRPIYSLEKLQGSTIPKIDKPDFEAIEMISDTELLLFGSGSKSPERDVCIWIDLNEEDFIYHLYDIGNFYNHLRSHKIMQGYELNIEAFALKEDICYLFNRGRDVIFSFSLSEFSDFCRKGASFPKVIPHLFSLPEIHNLKTGFSGATSFKHQPYLIFTATAEDTPNAYDDGEILGSLIGVIKINPYGLDRNVVVQPISNPGFPLKVESVIVDKIVSKTETDLVLVTDNDGQDSHILRARMTLI